MTSHQKIVLNAHLLSGKASYRSAGIHGYIFNTLAHLPFVEPSFTYTALISRGYSPPELDGIVFKQAQTDTTNPIKRILWEQMSQPSTLRQIKPKLVHGMAFSLPLFWSGPSVVTIYDLSFIREPQRLSSTRRMYLNSMVRFAAKKARRIIAISESGKSEIVEILGAEPDHIDVAVPGVGTGFRQLSADSLSKFAEDKDVPNRYILHVGTLEPRKNLETLVKAYARLDKNLRSEVKLVFIGGKGWQTDTLFSLIDELGIPIVQPGYVPGEELPLWYNLADVFVYPSVYEGFGLPIIEAMACGTPVIAADTTSLPEAAGNAGILIPPYEVDTWANTLTNLLENSDRRRSLSARGLKHVKSFSWQRTAEQTVKSYRLALA